MKQETNKSTNKSIDVKRVTIFTILMVIVLGSMITLYCIARPFVENDNFIIALIIGIIAVIVGYLYAVVGGVPLPRPKSEL